jgi:hypothetical protein
MSRWTAALISFGAGLPVGWFSAELGRRAERRRQERRR